MTERKRTIQRQAVHEPRTAHEKRTVATGAFLTFLSILTLAGFLSLAAPAPLRGQDNALSDEEKREQVAAERFLDLLLRRPTTGTALERVFGFHVARGTLSELLDDLRGKAEQMAADEPAGGNHWMVIGLLQLQRESA